MMIAWSQNISVQLQHQVTWFLIQQSHHEAITIPESYSFSFLRFYPICLHLLLAPRDLSSLWDLPAVPNLRRTICLMYKLPGKCLLSFGTVLNCGNQYATYSPSGSYVCAWKCKAITILLKFIFLNQDVGQGN